MIDKLDIEIPKTMQPRRELSRLMNAAHELGREHCTKSQHYERVYDFRFAGIPARLSTCNLHSWTSGDKLELIDVAERSLRESSQIVSELYRDHWSHCPIMRIDTAADVPDVPVEWFRKNVRVAYKQSNTAIGFMEVGKRHYQTLYAGRRPSVYRIYDKVGEYIAQYQRTSRSLSREARQELPKFEELYKIKADAILTRVERQIPRKDAEKLGIFTVDEIPKLTFINPFDRMRFLEEKKLAPNSKPLTFAQRMAVESIQKRIDEFGLEFTRSWLAQQVGRKNIHREWSKYQPYLRADKIVQINKKILRQSFLKTFLAQSA